MAGVERWYKKWEALDVDSEGEEAPSPPKFDEATEQVLRSLPQDVAQSIRKEPSRSKREALLALNCYICELHGPPRQTPSSQQQLLAALGEALRGLEEGGEVETLLYKVHSTLCHQSVCSQNVEHGVGACAMLAPKLRERRLVEVILRAGVERVADFPAGCLARVCWSAAALADVDAAAPLLLAATSLAERRAAEFEAADVALLAWACATARPPSSRQLLRLLLEQARLPSADTPEARIMAWALESWGVNAAPFFGLPPTTVPEELATGLHRRLRALCAREEVEVLHSADPQVLCIHDLVAPEEAAALLEIAEGRWCRSAVGSGGQSDWRTSESVLLESPAGHPVPVLERVRRRATALLGLPESHCEAPQAARYLHGQKYEEHVDYFSNDRANRGLLYLGGQRVATVLIYLSTVPEGAGGETRFPRLGVAAPAVQGRALVWLNVDAHGNGEERTTHTAAPILDECCAKNVLSLWLHAYPVQQAATPSPARNGNEASSTGLPQVPCPQRPPATVERGEAGETEMGDELQRLTTTLDAISDPAVRESVLKRFSESKRADFLSAAAPPPSCAAPPSCPADPEPFDCEGDEFGDFEVFQSSGAPSSGLRRTTVRRPGTSASSSTSSALPAPFAAGARVLAAASQSARSWLAAGRSQDPGPAAVPTMRPAMTFVAVD